MRKFYFLILFSICSISNSNSQIINIPDANFKAKLLEASPTNNIAGSNTVGAIKIDTNNDGEIQISEALQVNNLSVNNSSISSLEGINNFANLTGLICADNLLTTLDTSGLSLTSLYCYNNQLTSLVLSTSASLTNLDFSDNLMTTFTAPYTLLYLGCSNNLLTELLLPSEQIRSVGCSNNLIQNLNLQYKPNLITLICNNNLLQSLDFNNINFTPLNSLNFVSCNNNQLLTLDVSKLNVLGNLSCANNLLTSINMKNGKNETLDFSGNPNLQYICADDSQLQAVEGLIVDYGYANCFANSYCTLDPGGVFYNIRGFARLDSDGNGCSSSDINFSTINLAIGNGTNTANYTTCGASLGMYSYNVQAGNYTVTPVLENPDYFNISPSSVNIIFPSQPSPFTQNFCLSPNGMHPDVEVVLLPITIASPGFDAGYKLIYKNKGNTTQSGTVGLTFNDSILDNVSANPVASSQSLNNFSWNFSGLLPFETRIIELVFNINSPTESPAVNSGDILEYSANINTSSVDDTPNDNTLVHHQTVVNSLDPNDKICLEGTTVGSEAIGNYVHYMIRFENTGTSFAPNVIVSDLIDVSKFDLSTFVAMNGSHPYVTKVIDNKVEFIFKNIYLSNIDSNNKGYVSFKIKTRPSLSIGDTFTNSANIYFDYNFPIVTNTATTAITTLGTNDFDFTEHFTLFPNPSRNTLNVKVSEGTLLKSVSIYNMLGQLLMVTTENGSDSEIDVSDLAKGNYFIRINSDKGSSTQKFVKE